MALTLFQGTVTQLERDGSILRFRIGKHLIQVSLHPDLLLLENGASVQLLAEPDPRTDALDVMALKWEGGPTVYLGPRMGWSVSLAALTVTAAAFISQQLWLLMFPAMLAVAKWHFLRRRARVFESFASELAELTNLRTG
jgi:hypothetical protein